MDIALDTDIDISRCIEEDTVSVMLNPPKHRWQALGLQAESGPLPCLTWPSTLLLPSYSAELALNCSVVAFLQY